MERIIPVQMVAHHSCMGL